MTDSETSRYAEMVRTFENRKRARSFAFGCGFISIWFLLSGLGLTAMGHWLSNDGDSNTRTLLRTMAIIGPIILALGLVMLVIAIVAWIRSNRNRSGTLQTNQTSGNSTVTGTTPQQEPLMTPPPYVPPQPTCTAGVAPPTCPGVGYHPTEAGHPPGPGSPQYRSPWSQGLGATYSVPPSAPPVPSAERPEVDAPPPSYDEVLEKDCEDCEDLDDITSYLQRQATSL